METTSTDSECLSHKKRWDEHSRLELDQDVVDRVVMSPSADRIFQHGDEKLAKVRRLVQGGQLWKELKLLSPEEKKECYWYAREWDVWALREDIQITKNRNKVIEKEKKN